MIDDCLAVFIVYFNDVGAIFAWIVVERKSAVGENNFTAVIGGFWTVGADGDGFDFAVGRDHEASGVDVHEGFGGEGDVFTGAGKGFRWGSVGFGAFYDSEFVVCSTETFAVAGSEIRGASDGVADLSSCEVNFEIGLCFAEIGERRIIKDDFAGVLTVVEGDLFVALIEGDFFESAVVGVEVN